MSKSNAYAKIESNQYDELMKKIYFTDEAVASQR